MNKVDILSQLFNNMGLFLGIFSRIIGFFVTIPIFNSSNIPAYAKISISLLVSFVLLPIIKTTSPMDQEKLLELMLFLSKELLTGIILGFICYIFFSIVYLVGHIVDMELGFMIASVINPEDDTEIPLTANAFYMLASLIFLLINGHHSLIKGFIDSYYIVPLGSLNFNYLMIDSIITTIISTFIIALKMSAPILVSIFLTNILLGILARTMPQMNVFMVGMPLKILVGLIIFAIVLPLYGGAFEHIYSKMLESFNEFAISITKG